MLKRIADDAWPWTVPEITLKDMFLRLSRLTDSLARACLSMSNSGYPICLRTSLMWDLEAVSNPASMSVWIRLVLIPLHLILSMVLQRVNIIIMFWWFIGLYLVSPRPRVRIGHCPMNHSSRLEETPLGPLQILLFSLALALLSSSMPMGASRSLLYLLLNLGILLRNHWERNRWS